MTMKACMSEGGGAALYLQAVLEAGGLVLGVLGDGGV